MVEPAHPCLLGAAQATKTFRRCQQVRNPLERDWQFKRALGFSEEIATRVTGILRWQKAGAL